MTELVVSAEEEQRSSGAVIKLLVQRIADLEQARGITIDWLGCLKDPGRDYTSRDVINAMGETLNAVGVPNNLYFVAEKARP